MTHPVQEESEKNDKNSLFSSCGTGRGIRDPMRERAKGSRTA